MNLPNSITLIRICSIPLLIWILSSSHFSSQHGAKELLASAIFIAASMTDGIDGYLARKRGQIDVYKRQPVTFPLNEIRIEKARILIGALPEEPHLLRRTVAASVRSIGNDVELQFAPVPSTANRRPVAGTEQPVFLGRLRHKRHKVRTIEVGTEPNQITGAALRTYYAVTKTVSHVRFR